MEAADWWNLLKIKYKARYNVSDNLPIYDDQFLEWADYWHEGLTPEEALNEYDEDNS